MNLYQQWIEAKAAEEAAVTRRREIEDAIAASIDLDPAAEGTKKINDGRFVVTITTRHNRKVDDDLLQDIAAEHGLSDHLGTLFRWKPELNMRAWKNASPQITGPLAAAITSKPGRPSFSITTEE